MESVTCLCIVLAEILCFVQAQNFEIKKEFIDGNLTFTWTNVSTRRNDIVIRKDGRSSDWIQITDDKYTVEDVWKYKSVTINVREYTSAGHRSYKDYNSTYTVSRIDSQEGDTTNLTFTADFIPKSGKYDIYHFYDGTSNRIIRVTSNMTSSMNYSKYAYHTRPYTSTDITFEVKNITLMDAGYYGIRTTEIAARSGQGVVLVVKGKPAKPEIARILKVAENSDVILTCSSNSTSRPSYYRKTVSLTYIWYRNNTVIDSKTRMTLRFPRISRDFRFNKYSCQSKESIASEKSEEIQINVLYGPSSITVTPQLPVNKTMAVNNGGYLGPYYCHADCNPPCTIQWKYKLSNGTFREAKSNGSTLLQQRVFRDQLLFRCMAKSTSGKLLHTPIILYIMYLAELSLSVNGKLQGFLDVREGEPLTLSCVVDGKPTPRIKISRYSQNEILESKVSNAVNVSIPEVQCSNTDIYRCTGSSMGFVTKQREVTIGVLCKTRIDVKAWFKADFGIKSENGVKVIVNAPIISYPKPSPNLISWSGPISAYIQNEIKERGDVIYKHWVTSTVPVDDQRYFGNYTMIYNGEVIFTIAIKDEGKPKPPLDFTGYSYKSGYINLTWISDFNGGPEQFFILSQKDGAAWVAVANLTDPGEGDMGYYDPGLLNPGREYWYRLESCNRINCSVRAVEVKVTVLDCERGYYLNVKNPELHNRKNSACGPCGNCRDNVPCNTTTGQCSDGCKANYKPPYCTELITADNAVQTTTIIIAILSTVSIVAIATIIGMIFRQRLKRRSESKPPEPENECNRTMDATRQRLRSDGGPEVPLHDYDKINTTMDAHTYDQVGLSNEDDYQDVQACGSSTGSDP